MNKSTILDYVRSRMYLMGSNAAPSFADETLYPFLDRAQQISITDAVKFDRLDLISELIVTAGSTEFDGAVIDNNLWKSGSGTDIQSEFFMYITGSILMGISTGDGRGIDSYEKVPLETVSIKYFDIVLDKSNRMTFPKPKIFFGHNGEFISVLKDSVSSFGAGALTASDLVEIKYVKNPDLFSGMEGSQSPKISAQLHLDIVEKASELAMSSISPQRAGQQIQNNNQQ